MRRSQSNANARRRHRRRCVSLGVVLALALAACGTDEPVATDTPSGEEAMVAQEDDEVPAPTEEEADASDEQGEAEIAPTDEALAEEAPGGEGPAGEEATPDERVEVPEILAFTAPAVGGGEVDGADAAGHPVALWFWAPWCPTCNREAPEAARLAHEYGDTVRFIGVAGLDDLGEMEDFVATHDVDHFPHAATEDGELWVRFGVSYQPAWIILDADGEVALSRVRPSLDAVRDALDEVSSGS